MRRFRLAVMLVLSPVCACSSDGSPSTHDANAVPADAASADAAPDVDAGQDLGAGVVVATGDSRAVTEPVFPAVCSQVQATKFIVSTNTINVDPYNPTCVSGGGTKGTLGCTGGTSYEPSSTASPTFTSDETDDVAVLQAALNACPSGKAVEIVAQGSKRALVVGRFSIPSGVGLILDAGIHVYASRDRTVYGGSFCGQVTTNTSFCNHWITAPSTTGSGIYGYGVLDGRGWDAYVGATTDSFYAARIQSYCNKRGSATDGSPACTPNSAGNNSYGPNILFLDGANDFRMYKVTLKDAGNFNIAWKGSDGGTFWGVKVLAPFEVPNTDGWDPINSRNGTFTRGWVSTGDNNMAVKGQDAAARNITFSHNQTGGGAGIAIGADTGFGVSNVLVTDNVQNGNLKDAIGVGLQIGSEPLDGGTVDAITMQNDCMMNEARSIRVYTDYNSESGTKVPSFHDILLRDIHVLASSAGKSGKFTFQGYDAAHPILGQLSNITIDGTNEGVQQQASLTKDQFGDWLIGPGEVDPSILAQFAPPAGIDVTTTGSGAPSTPYPCDASMWKPLVGELNLATSQNNNNQAWTGAAPFSLDAIVEPTTAINTHEQPAPDGSVQFKDNGVVIATVPISGDNRDGTYATTVVSSATSGTHVYTATYTGDSSYPDLSFGSVTVTVP